MRVSILTQHCDIRLVLPRRRCRYFNRQQSDNKVNKIFHLHKLGYNFFFKTQNIAKCNTKHKTYVKY